MKSEFGFAIKRPSFEVSVNNKKLLLTLVLNIKNMQAKSKTKVEGVLRGWKMKVRYSKKDRKNKWIENKKGRFFHI